VRRNIAVDDVMLLDGRTAACCITTTAVCETTLVQGHKFCLSIG